MLDFTSALYLGLRHPSESLGAWDALTLGRPAALVSRPTRRSVAAESRPLCRVARRARSCPRHCISSGICSAMLGQGDMVILRDEGAYPIARWGTERAQAMGVRVRTFPHHDSRSLERLIADSVRRRLKPIVVADGYCPRCGAAAPIKAYAELVERSGGYLVLDDTQALGILGRDPDGTNPYGSGGGGSLRWHDTFGRHIIAAARWRKRSACPWPCLPVSAGWSSGSGVRARRDCTAVRRRSRSSVRHESHCGRINRTGTRCADGCCVSSPACERC